MSPKERMGYFALTIFFLFAAGYVGARQLRRHDAIVVQELSPPRTPGTIALPDGNQPVVVHVAGSVVNPGVYKLPPGSRVTDAIKAAGGFKGEVDQSQLNLAAKLIDGGQVLVGAKGSTIGSDAGSKEGEPKPSRSRGAKHPSRPVSLSNASEEQLETVPGIGPSTAEKILDYRKEHGGFKSVDELTAVGGIGPKKLAKMQKWLVP